MATIEVIRSITIFRSGSRFPFRTCPKHGTELELCLDDTDYSAWSPGHAPLYDHHDNRVCWRCDECLGFWLENHFIDQPESELPHKIQEMHLVLPCPDCGSRRVTHGCDPGCCNYHLCVDCESRFEAEVAIVRRGPNVDQPRRRRYRGRLGIGSGPLDPESCLRTGIVRSYRSMPGTCEHPLELVLDSPDDSQGTRVGWFCEACERVYYEVGALRRRRPGFRHEVEAAVLCPACRSRAIDNSHRPDEPLSCTCRACGSELEIALAAMPPVRRRH